MSKIVGFQCDALESLNPFTDSTLLFARKCFEKGCVAFFFEPKNVFLSGGSVYASGANVSFSSDDMELPHIVSYETMALSWLSACFVRQNPPFDIQYIFNMHLLERLEGPVKFFNPPSAIRNHPEKLTPLSFPKYIPKTFIGSESEKIVGMLNECGSVVLKSLYGFGGFDVLKISSEDELLNQGAAFVKKHGAVIAQEFLEAVYEGDKRVLILDGEVVGYYRRIPASGSYLTNTVQGGGYELCELTDLEFEISREVASFLKLHGIVIAGIDLIGEKLIEVNITSPTGFTLYNRLTGEDCTKSLRV